MTQMFAVDPAEIADLRAEVREIKHMLQAAQIQPKPEWLTADEACEDLGVSRSTLDRLVRKGAIEKHGAGKARRYRVR